MKWHHEMALERHEVWDLVNRPREKKVTRCKWIFSKKIDSISLEKTYKARLVALGCAQRPGFDYEETFSPTIRIIQFMC